MLGHRQTAGPRRLCQPLEQRPIVGQAAQEALEEVRVRVDQAGEHRLARRVDDFVGLSKQVFWRRAALHRLDAFPAHEHVAGSMRLAHVAVAR